MKLIKCTSCNVLVTFEKRDIKRHEATHHEYQAFDYEFYTRKPLTDKEKIALVSKVEKRIGIQRFIGFGVDTSEASVS